MEMETAMAMENRFPRRTGPVYSVNTEILMDCISKREVRRWSTAWQHLESALHKMWDYLSDFPMELPDPSAL